MSHFLDNDFYPCIPSTISLRDKLGSVLLRTFLGFLASYSFSTGRGSRCAVVFPRDFGSVHPTTGNTRVPRAKFNITAPLEYALAQLSKSLLGGGGQDFSRQDFFRPAIVESFAESFAS